jgi:hypothetical protein
MRAQKLLDGALNLPGSDVAFQILSLDTNFLRKTGLHARHLYHHNTYSEDFRPGPGLKFIWA